MRFVSLHQMVLFHDFAAAIKSLALKGLSDSEYLLYLNVSFIVVSICEW